MTTWPAVLTRAPLQVLIGEAHPDVAFGNLVAEVAQVQGVPTKLPFVAQTQLQDNWCWSAVATSIGLHYGTGNWTQCAIATEQVNNLISPGGVNDCCTTPGSAGCNVYGYVYFSLQQARSIDRWSPVKPSPQEIHDLLSRKKELVCLRIAWTGGGAHFTTINGATDPSDGGAFIV